jgi:hypothetical protein
MNANSVKCMLDFTKTISENFNSIALSTFKKQLNETIVYNQFCQALGKDVHSLTHWSEIPFLPISFFKTHRVCQEKPIVHTFESSGTGGNRSRHFVNDLSLYEESFFPTFKEYVGTPLAELSILALLPCFHLRTKHLDFS